MKKRLKINGVIMFLATIVLTAFPLFFFRIGNSPSLDYIMDILGITFILLGQLIRISARGFKAQNSQNGNNLIQDGPYSLVRNPMYLGIFLIGLGVILMLFKFWVLFLFTAFFLMRYILLIRDEEKKLKSLFPQSYASYCRNVPYRIFPPIKLLLEVEVQEYLPLRLKWIKKELGSILAVLFLAILLEVWEDIAKGKVTTYAKEAIGILAIFILFSLMVMYLNYYTVRNHDSDKS